MATNRPSTTARAARPGNQVARVSRWRALGRGALAAGLGALLAGAFAPLGWSWLAWVGLVPLLALMWPAPRRAGWLGYAFGLGHFIVALAWLRVAFPPVSYLFPLGLALICACFTAAWLALAHALAQRLQVPAAQALDPRTDPRRPFVPRLTAGGEVVLWLVLPAAWSALEWVRTWIFTGFPWDLLGVSQWQHLALLPLTRFTGVYGLSYLLVAVNVALFLLARNLWAARHGQPANRVPWPLLLTLPLLATPWLAARVYTLPPPAATLRVAAVQGNLPQMRAYSPAELQDALRVYPALTRQVVALDHPTLVVWPETAIPAPLLLDQGCADALRDLLRDTQTPLLAGSLDYRYPPGSTGAVSERDVRAYNSILVLDRDGKLLSAYDKMHPVPFGEYVPFSRYLPALVNWIGMGRDLDAGTEYTTWAGPAGSRFGFGICFEDVFPAISRGMVLRGANLLLVVTNDAWYDGTSGPRQHLAHAVFRAVETMRPLLRNGNNSDTCLILPDGRLVDELRDPATGSSDVRAAHTYTLPIYPAPPLTWYTRHGDLFAHATVAVTLLALLYLLYRALDRRRRLHALITPAAAQGAAGEEG